MEVIHSLNLCPESISVSTVSILSDIVRKKYLLSNSGSDMAKDLWEGLETQFGYQFISRSFSSLQKNLFSAYSHLRDEVLKK